MTTDRLLKSSRSNLVLAAGILGLSLTAGGTALANTSPNGPGQPGAPQTTCGSSQSTSSTPGGSTSAQGSPFNSSGQAGAVYAGNPGTASLANANSPKAVSQYDIACFQVTTASHH
jgi:hypothetical protein